MTTSQQATTASVAANVDTAAAPKPKVIVKKRTRGGEGKDSLYATALLALMSPPRASKQTGEDVDIRSNRRRADDG